MLQINKSENDNEEMKERNAFLATTKAIQKKIEDQVKNQNRKIATRLDRTTDRSEINIF